MFSLSISIFVSVKLKMFIVLFVFMTHSLHSARSVPWFSSFYWFFRIENSQASIFLCKQFGFTVLRRTIEIQLQLQRKQFNLKFKITLSTVRSFKVKRSTDIYSACEIISRNLLWAVVIVEKSVRKLNCNVLTQHIAVYTYGRHTK